MVLATVITGFSPRWSAEIASCTVASAFLRPAIPVQCSCASARLKLVTPGSPPSPIAPSSPSAFASAPSPPYWMVFTAFCLARSKSLIARIAAEEVIRHLPIHRHPSWPGRKNPLIVIRSRRRHLPSMRQTCWRQSCCRRHLPHEESGYSPARSCC